MKYSRQLFGVALILLMTSALLRPAAARAQDERLHVVASFSILADVVGQVAGDAADVELLIPLGADPHTFEASAQNVVTLSDADVVFIVGLNFEAGLLDVLNEAAGDRVVSVSDCVAVREVSREIDPDHAGEDQHALSGELSSEAAQTCQTHHDSADHILGAGRTTPGDALGMAYTGVCQDTPCDPHVWTDPANVALWALTIRDTLSALDPDRAATYAANTDAYLTELAALDTELAGLIESIPAERRVIMTNHASLNYFAARYGLRLAGVVIPGGSTASEPSVEDVLNLIETVQKNDVRVIFTESTVREDLAQQVADETGARIVQLYEGSLTEPDGPASTYLDYMRLTAQTIHDALSEG